MPITKRFDLLRDFAYRSIKDHIDSTDGNVGSFMHKLQNIEDGIFEECRDNEIELADAPERYQRLCSDLKKKVEIIADRLFNQDKNQVIYRQLGIIIKEGGGIEAEYCYWLYGSLYNIINHFKEKSNSDSPGISEEKRTTRFQSFTLKNQLCINDLYDQMVSFGYILRSETDKKIFTHAFQGTSVATKIKWHGDIEELRYFILCLKREQLFTPVDNDHWLIASKCFIHFDGTSFDTEQFRTSHKPNDTSNIDKMLTTVRST